MTAMRFWAVGFAGREHAEHCSVSHGFGPPLRRVSSCESGQSAARMAATTESIIPVARCGGHRDGRCGSDARPGAAACESGDHRASPQCAARARATARTRRRRALPPLAAKAVEVSTGSAVPLGSVAIVRSADAVGPSSGCASTTTSMRAPSATSPAARSGRRACTTTGSHPAPTPPRARRQPWRRPRGCGPFPPRSPRPSASASTIPPTSVLKTRGCVPRAAEC